MYTVESVKKVLFCSRSLRERRRRFANATAYMESSLFKEDSTVDLLNESRDQMNKTMHRQLSEPKAKQKALRKEREEMAAGADSGAGQSKVRFKARLQNAFTF